MTEPRPIDDIPPQVIQTLAVRWMESFEKAARSQNKPGVMGLFDPNALICGSQKGGPLDQLQSKHFKFEMDASKMIPHPPCVLVVVQWHAVSDIHGGPTRIGDATLFLGAEMDPKGNRFLCYHAHFSMQ